MQGVESRPDIANRILRALAHDTLERIWPALERVELKRGQPIGTVDQRVRRVYFVERGLISVVKTMRDGRSIEIGAIGIEGLTDPIVLFGVNGTLLDSVVQVPGTAFRGGVEEIRDAMRQDPAMAGLMQRYLRFSFHQLAQTAACNRLHSLEERCCRWLLIAHDSAHGDSFPLTHEFLAMMLGVQRAGVTIAANALRNAGLIAYTHGQITIANRAGLEEAACECYRSIEDELEVVFRPAPH